MNTGIFNGGDLLHPALLTESAGQHDVVSELDFTLVVAKSIGELPPEPAVR